MRVILVILFFTISQLGHSQSEIKFYLEDVKLPFPVGTKSWVDSSENYTFEHFQNNRNQFSSQLPLSASNLNGKIWILIPLDSNLTPLYPYAVITNPHVNYVQAWWLDKDTELIKESKKTGDHLSFNTREALSHSFTFLNPDEAKAKFLLIAIDKRNEGLVINLHLTSHRFIENRLTQETALFGWLLGIVLVIFIITCVLYYFAKDRIYLLYSGFLFFMLTYSVADFSFWHWLFAYDIPRNFDSIRPITLAVSFLFYVLFILQSLNIKSNLPKSFKVLRLGFIAFVIYFIVALCIYFFTKNNEVKFYGVLISHYFQRGLLSILVVIVIQATIKKIPFALLISISLILFLVVHLVNHYFENGTIQDNLLFEHFLPLIYTLDCLIMSVIIARTFLRFQKKSLDLSNELLIQNIDFTNKLNEVKEKDLTRISQYLHDNIGAEISAMRYELEALKNNPDPSIAIDRIIAKSSFIANEVRNASHNLSPIMLERFGLEESVSQFLSQINKTTNCNFQLDVIGNLDLIDKNLNIVLFQIIQECIQNILKHAQAKNTIIQILNESKSIQLFIEDDGIGFNLNNVQYGLGLDSIKKLIEFKQGEFRIDSSETKGVKIYVELPNQPD